jgi:Glutathione S-transferase, N-terminal domain
LVDQKRKRDIAGGRAGMLELYHHGSSVYAAKVRLALAEKELAWESHYVDILAGEQFHPDFRAINPKAVVPVLVHDGQVLFRVSAPAAHARIEDRQGLRSQTS